jgi:hypothetical protein
VTARMLQSSSTRPAVVPLGCWPRRMCADLAAGYCGERTVQAFIARVGTEYPQPRVNEGRRRLWLRDDLDRAIQDRPDPRASRVILVSPDLRARLVLLAPRVIQGLPDR